MRERRLERQDVGGRQKDHRVVVCGERVSVKRETILMPFSRLGGSEEHDMS